MLRLLCVFFYNETVHMSWPCQADFIWYLSAVPLKHTYKYEHHILWNLQEIVTTPSLHKIRNVLSILCTLCLCMDTRLYCTKQRWYTNWGHVQTIYMAVWLSDKPFNRLSWIIHSIKCSLSEPNNGPPQLWPIELHHFPLCERQPSYNITAAWPWHLVRANIKLYEHHLRCLTMPKIYMESAHMDMAWKRWGRAGESGDHIYRLFALAATQRMEKCAIVWRRDRNTICFNSIQTTEKLWIKCCHNILPDCPRWLLSFTANGQ